MFQLFRKRTWDISAVTDKSVKVKFNNEVIPVKSFENYTSKQFYLIQVINGGSFKQLPVVIHTT